MKVGIVLVVCALVAPLHSECADRDSVRLNPEALNFARELIIQGRFVADKKGAWSTDHPTRSQETAFIRANGFSEYAKWHLARDERHSPNSKARYKFPFGDFERVHRCGLLAVKARAREYGYREIEAAADELLRKVSAASKNSAGFRRTPLPRRLSTRQQSWVRRRPSPKNPYRPKDRADRCKRCSLALAPPPEALRVEACE